MSDGGPYRSDLSELIEALASARTAAEVADAVWSLRAEACGASAAGVLMADPEVRLLQGTGRVGVGGVDLDPLLGAELVQARSPLFFGSAAALRQAYPVLCTDDAHPPGEACAVLPLAGPGTPPGALLAVWDTPRAFGSAERRLLTALAGLCAAELARVRALDRERELLERLRRRLRPDRLPVIAGAEMADRHEPVEGADAALGFYDVFPTGTGTWRLVAGAVAGRGADAVVLAGLAGQAFRAPACGPAAALRQLHSLVREFGTSSGRISAACVDLVRRGPGFALTAARAGHPPPLVLRGTGVVLSVDVPGGPPGGRRDPEPAELSLDLQPGDTLLLRAGGNGHGPAGDHRFAAVLAGCAGWAPAELLEHVGLALADRPGSAGDGASFLALRVRGGGRTRTGAAWRTG